MDALLILALSSAVVYLLVRLKRSEMINCDEIERLHCINDNLRLHIQELETDLDRVCTENRKLKAD